MAQPPLEKNGAYAYGINAALDPSRTPRYGLQPSVCVSVLSRPIHLSYAYHAYL